MQLTQANAEGILYKCIHDIPPSSTWGAVKNRLCQVLSLVAPKLHAAT